MSVNNIIPFPARQPTLDDLAGLKHCEEVRKRLNNGWGLSKVAERNARRQEPVYTEVEMETNYDQGATTRGRQCAVDMGAIVAAGMEYAAHNPNETTEMVLRRMYKMWEAMYAGEWVK